MSRLFINALKGAIATVGNDRISVQEGEIGTHSIWLGVASSYGHVPIGEVPVYIIMILGRYIRKEVAQFNRNVSNFTDTYLR